MDLIIVNAALVSFLGLVISQVAMPERRATATQTTVTAMPRPAAMTRVAAAAS